MLRIHQTEGRQCGDVAIFNAHDYKESFHAGQTWAINVILGTGTSKCFKHFYSKPPRENVMFSVVEDTCKNHWGSSGARCSARLYQLRNKLTNHRSCQENLAEALAPHGISGDDIFDIFNVFMNVELFPDGGFRIKPTEVTKDDYIDLKAEMDLLVGISACPADNTSPTNGGTCKSLGVKVFA